MQSETALTAVGHAIQLSVAPVFLLTAIGALLGVLTNRFGRVIDRARATEERLKASGLDETAAHAHLATLARRAKLINRAITLCTITALFVCCVVATLFLGAFLGFQAAGAVAALFVAAMATMIAGLLFFLREIFVATRSLRIGFARPGGAHGEAASAAASRARESSTPSGR